jgi:hypothetical protein
MNRGDPRWSFVVLATFEQRLVALGLKLTSTIPGRFWLTEVNQRLWPRLDLRYAWVLFAGS